MKEYIIKILKNPFVFNLLLAGVITLVLLGGVMFWLSSYTRHNEAVVVPDVRGLKVEEAAEYFDRSNLRYNVIDSVFSSDVPAGAIVEMIPEAGAKTRLRSEDHPGLPPRLRGLRRGKTAAGGVVRCLERCFRKQATPCISPIWI